MTVYFIFRQIPELAPLTARQRRAVVNSWWMYHAREHQRDHYGLLAAALLVMIVSSTILREGFDLPLAARFPIAAALAAIPLTVLQVISLRRLSCQAGLFVRQCVS